MLAFSLALLCAAQVGAPADDVDGLIIDGSFEAPPAPRTEWRGGVGVAIAPLAVRPGQPRIVPIPVDLLVEHRVPGVAGGSEDGHGGALYLGGAAIVSYDNFDGASERDEKYAAALAVDAREVWNEGDPLELFVLFSAVGRIGREDKNTLDQGLVHDTAYQASGILGVGAEHWFSRDVAVRLSLPLVTADATYETGKQESTRAFPIVDGFNLRRTDLSASFAFDPHVALIVAF